MNSTFLVRVHGFLNRRSVSHSVELCAKAAVVPNSSSSQFSIGVISTAAVGPALQAVSLKFQLGAPPISRIAIGSWPASAWAIAFREQRSRKQKSAALVISVNAHLTATITGALSKPATLTTTGTEPPGVIPFGTYAFTWYSPAKPPTRPLKKTWADLPPMVTVTVFVVLDGGENGAALPAVTGGLTDPSPAQ